MLFTQKANACSKLVIEIFEKVVESVKLNLAPE